MTSAENSPLPLIGAGLVMLAGAAALIVTGYHADATGGSLPTWQFVTPWLVFLAGGVLTLWSLIVRGRRTGQTWAWAAAIMVSVPTLGALATLGAAVIAP